MKNSLHSVLGRVDPLIGGYNIYDEEWDLCVIIDACRADMFHEVADSYDWMVSESRTRRSVGAATRNWLRRTFTADRQDKMAQTDYVMGNAYADLILDADDFQTLDKVYEYAWDHEVGATPARAVTERGIDTARNGAGDRLIVHYLQPHFPSIPDHLGYNMNREAFRNHSLDEGGVEWDGVWPALENGEVTAERVWEAYRENLRYVLNEVELLLQNVDAENAILSSDHGNAFGEWWAYGHPSGVFVPVNRNVPYVEVAANDEETIEPSLERHEAATEDSEEAVNERLAALGYR